MKNKILGLIVCMLLLATVVSPFIGIANTINLTSSEEDSVLDYSTPKQSGLGERDTINAWVNMTPDGSISKRKTSGMVYDSTNDRTILLGGSIGATKLNDTWLYNYSNNTWYNANPGFQGPGTLTPRDQFEMAYDSVHDRTLAFGGCTADAGGQDNTTWLYNFSDNIWYNMTPDTSGGTLYKRSGHAMTFDSDAERVVLFGGYWEEGAPPPYFLNDTWEYNFTDNKWIKLSTSDSGGSLPRVAAARLAYDSANQVSVLFGGAISGSGDNNNETWVFHYGNKTWVKKNPDFVGGTLAERAYGGMAYDSDAERVVLFGGSVGSHQLNDTWLYNVAENTWYNVSYSAVGGILRGRSSCSAVYDSSARKVILFGGLLTSTVRVNETWIFLYSYENQAPATPTKPSGPTWLNLNAEGTYNTSAVDPDVGDKVQYRFDWDANGSHDYSDWTKLVPSGTQLNLSNSWETGGTYVVKAQARDLLRNKSDWSNGLTVVVNSAPNKPQEPDPPNEATNVDADATLSWNCSDHDGDQLFYDVYFEENNPIPDKLVSSNQTQKWYDPGTMNYSTRYYWRIVAWDEHGISTKGETWYFTTIMTKPTVGCSGSLSWTEVKPRETVSGSFTVSNIGELQSLLDWEISDWPKDWGSNWAFTPISGDDLKPSDGPITINVSVRAPNEKNSEFEGEIKIINKENSSDFCTIDVSLATPKNKPFNFNFPLLSWLFERFPNAFPILRQLLEL